MKITNLAGVFTGAGFRKKGGRLVDWSDCGFIAGPVDIALDSTSGQILSIEKSGGAPSAAPSWDGTGLIATAGFVDSHTHAIFAGDRSQEYFLRWGGAGYAEIAAQGGGIHNTMRDTREATSEQLYELLRERLLSMRETGTTTVEIKSGYGANAEEELRLLRLLKNFRQQKHADLPDLRITFLGLHALPKDVPEQAFVDSMIGILPTIKKESLADFIDAFPEKGFFSLSESLRFAEAGLQQGLKVKIHADEITDMDAAASFAEKKALSVDHLQKISDRGVNALTKGPTVATLLPATSFFLGIEYANARRLCDAGVSVALATDFNPGTAPESSMLFTMKLAAAQMKLSAPEILCGATWNGAQALGLQDRGTLEPGMRGDILLWEAGATTKLSNKSLESLILGQFRICNVLSPQPA